MSVLLVEILIPFSEVRPGDRIEVKGEAVEVLSVAPSGAIMGNAVITAQTTSGPLTGPPTALVCVGITHARVL